MSDKKNEKKTPEKIYNEESCLHTKAIKVLDVILPINFKK